MQAARQISHASAAPHYREVTFVEIRKELESISLDEAPEIMRQMAPLLDGGLGHPRMPVGPGYHFQPGERCRHLLLVADRLATTRQALMRLSFRVLSHSAN